MKRYIYILCAMLTAVFASCSQSEMGDETSQSNQVTLNVTASQGLQTRAAATGVDRFAIEVYTDATYTTAANVFADGTNKANNATGAFTMVLDRAQEYHCLLWADKTGASVYDITSLNAVTLTGKAAEAWHGTKTIAAGATTALTASLTRAVSKISLMETGKLKSGSTLKLNFDQPTKFNVADGVASTTSARTEESIAIAANVDGTTTPAKLNQTDIFVLSSVATADLTDLTFQYDSEAEFIVSQAPLKANFNTNIKGHYTSLKSTDFTVTADDSWGGADNEATLPEEEQQQSLTWAAGNLIADGANGAKIGTATDKGLYFQFGSLIGWAPGESLAIAASPVGYTGSTSWSSSWLGNTATENVATGTGDPCAHYLKGTWRLPTTDEYVALFKDNGYPSTGPWTWNNTSKAATHTKGLTFPASGSISDQGELKNVGGHSYYWSASPSNENSANCLYFFSGAIFPSRSDYRMYGYPVRCVQDNE